MLTQKVKMQIKPISFNEVDRGYFFGDMSEIFLKINNFLKKEWRGLTLEINEFNLNLVSKWSSDGSVGEIVKAYRDVGWDLVIELDDNNYYTLIFKEQK